MKLRQSFILGAAFAAGIFGLGAVGCGDDSAATTSEGSGGSGGSSSATEGAGAGDVVLTKPPGRPSGAQPGDGPGVLLGISKLYLGDTDRNDTKSTTAWGQFGYDLDGQATIDTNGDNEFDGSDLGNHCTPVGGEVAAGNVEDGPGGVDNSFGKNILSFISSILEDPSATATEAIEEGSFTIALSMTTLGDGTDYSEVPTNLYAGINGDGAGNWEYVPELLNGGDPEDPKIRFDTAYVTGNTWVSGEPQLITLSLSIAGVDLALEIQQAVIAVTLNGDHSGGTDGVIAGVLDTDAFITELGEVASRVAGDTEGLCPGDQLFNSIVQNIVAASDILKDGTNKSGVQCDGISIAIGFDMNTVVFEGVATPAEPTPSACDD